MKNTTTWALKGRLSLARIIGRIMIIDAPVVPTTEASSAPMQQQPALISGVPWMLPATRMPPAMVNRREQKDDEGEVFEKQRVSTASAPARRRTMRQRIGSTTSAAQAAVILP